MRAALAGGLAAGLMILAGARAPAWAQMPDTHDGHGGTTHEMMENIIIVHAVADKLEAWIGSGQNAFHWDTQGWIGNDYDKLWLKSEGNWPGGGRLEDGRYELLYDRAISAYVALQAGVRADWDSGTGRGWAALGVRGLAPMFITYEATVYGSDQGHAAARAAASVDILITQRLILQPDIEVNFYSKADTGRAVGAGMADIDAGLRLRYEIGRKFAPYIGVVYAAKVGQTARLAQREGESAGGFKFVFGIRSWF